MQGRRRHEQLRRLRGGTTSNLVDRKVRQGVFRVLERARKVHPSTREGGHTQRKLFSPRFVSAAKFAEKYEEKGTQAAVKGVFKTER